MFDLSPSCDHATGAEPTVYSRLYSSDEEGGKRRKKKKKMKRSPFCGHADEPRLCIAPISLRDGAAHAFFCFTCGEAQKEAADAHQSGRKRVRTVGTASVGTCEMCYILAEVSVEPRDLKRVCGDCGTKLASAVTTKPEKTSNKVVKRFSGKHSTYFSLDLRALGDQKAWKSVFSANYSLLVVDVPWETVAGNTSQRNVKFVSVSNADLLRMARNSWSHAFNPSQEEPVGLAAFWCTSDTRELACQAMTLSGYKLLHAATWLKLSTKGQPMSYKAMARSNMEYVLLGIKGKRVRKLRAHYVDRCFQGMQYNFLKHSSKPVAFYEYLEWFLGLFFAGEVSYGTCSKLELFSRYAHEGWTCAGNEFLGFRSKSGELTL